MKAFVQVLALVAGELEGGGTALRADFAYSVMNPDGSVVDLGSQDVAYSVYGIEYFGYNDTAASMRTKITNHIRTERNDNTLAVVYITDHIGVL